MKLDAIILGVSFAENDENSIDIIEWPDNPITLNINKIPHSKDEVLKETLSGLKEVNEYLGTNYRLSKIYYVPWSDGPTAWYQYLIKEIIKYYHIERGNELEEEAVWEKL